ncbi:MAG: U32 family peptidase [Bacilli bacterium]|nr:U32 family peptidase [Bacilli bacterium]
MSKLIVTANSYEHMDLLLDKDIYGIMLYIDRLSVNSSFYVNIEDIEKIDFKGKKIFVVMNKIMHNNDLDMVREVLSKLKDKEYKILFYDMGVYNIAKELNIVNKLVIYQDHLNASIASNKFYYDLGIKGSYITSDITGEELLEINKSLDMDIYFLGYGFAPIFYSRRYLVKNYLKFINKEELDGSYTITSDTGVVYPIDEEKYGTAIYSPRPINLINYLDYLDSISYIVMNSNLIDDDEFNLMVDKFINRDKIDSTYLGFFNVKTIYKVKNN